MAVVHLSTSSQNAGADAQAAVLNSGTIEFRTGSMPANANATVSGTLLGTLNLGSTAFGAAASGVATANSITGDTSADNSGTATYARIKRSNSTVWADVDVTATGGGGTIEIDTTTIVAGQPISMTSFTITQPAS